MLWEGMVTEGLAVARAVHDRYDASRRNPWNEVEFGDHYARAMAAYGVFLAAGRFAYHGPKARLGVCAAAAPDDFSFQAPFLVAEGWGTFSQKKSDASFTARVALKWGRLRLRELSLQPAPGASHAVIALDGRSLSATLKAGPEETLVTLVEDAILTAGQTLQVDIS